MPPGAVAGARASCPLVDATGRARRPRCATSQTLLVAVRWLATPIPCHAPHTAVDRALQLPYDEHSRVVSNVRLLHCHCNDDLSRRPGAQLMRCIAAAGGAAYALHRAASSGRCP